MARKASVRPAWPPIRSKISRVRGLSPTMSAAPFAIPPKTAPAHTKPSVQPSRVVRCSRQARPKGPARDAGAWALPGRAGRKLIPRSRRAVRAYAAQTVSAVPARKSSAVPQRSPAYGRTCSAQPSGEIQVRGEEASVVATSPAARRAKKRPRTAPVRPLASRALSVNWAAMAASPAKSMPVPPTARPRAREPATGRPVPASPPVISTARPVLAIRAVSRAAVSGARRPTIAAESSS